MSLIHGGPAYPIPLNPGETYTSHGVFDGLTKRELFAAMAMQGFAADPGITEARPEALAAGAVRWADALLAELAKEPQA